MASGAFEIEYMVFGDDTQFVEIGLDPGEAAVAEAGSLMWMDETISMQTIVGDGSTKAGVIGGIFSGGKKLLSGEKLFTTAFTNQGPGKKRVAFAAPYPGKVIPLNLLELGGSVICQKDAFLCAAKGVSIGIAFQKRILTALFGGEGFILQKLSGDGMAFIHAGGMIIERQLKAEQSIFVDSGCVVAFLPSVTFDVRAVSGVKSMLFGGEGMFLAKLTGPGTIWMQSMPFSHLAGQIQSRLIEDSE